MTLQLRVKETDKEQCPHCNSLRIYYRKDAALWECLNCSGWFNVFKYFGEKKMYFHPKDE